MNSPLTELLIATSKGQLKTAWELGTQGPYQMFNDGGVEVEVGEFLYGLVRMFKPKRILETGTHMGISSSYIAMALRDNQMFGGQMPDTSPTPGPLGGVVGRGVRTDSDFTTLEIFDENIAISRKLWSTVLGGQLSSYINCVKCESLNYHPTGEFDMLFLDSEPQLRFDEFVKFWPQVKPGGIIMIHDLHPHLGHTGTINPDHPNEPDWPYGNFRDKLGPFIKQHVVQTMSFPTPRGFTVFQKMSIEHNAYNLLIEQ